MDNSISLDISKEVYSQRRIVKNNQENVDCHDVNRQLQQISNINHEKKYIGRMVMLSKKLNIFLGPNCKFFNKKIDGFFFIGFSMILAVSLILLYCSFVRIKNQQQTGYLHEIIKGASVLLTVWVNLMYLITALSDPGVYKPGKLFIKETDNLRNCSACKIKIPDNVRHCFTCDICIIEMDHHCPWMSKCVAKGNIKAFYGFIGGAFLMMALFWITIFVILTQ